MNKEKRLANFALLIFSGFSFLFLLLPVSPLVHRARVVSSYVFYPILDYGETFDYYLRGVPKNFALLLQTDQENRALRQQIKDAQITNAQAEALAEENRRLREIIGAGQALPWKGRWARVVERGPSHWHKSFLIDKGAVDGVFVNAAVLGADSGRVGLIGRISEVSGRNSKVLLVTDELSSVACYVRNKQWEGLVEGQGAEYLKLNYMPLEADIAADAELLTSPASLVFPSGILIGRISKFYPKESFMTFLSAKVLPAVRPDSVKEVFVLDKSAWAGKTPPEAVPGPAASSPAGAPEEAEPEGRQEGTP